MPGLMFLPEGGYAWSQDPYGVYMEGIPLEGTPPGRYIHPLVLISRGGHRNRRYTFYCDAYLFHISPGKCPLTSNKVTTKRQLLLQNRYLRSKQYSVCFAILLKIGVLNVLKMVIPFHLILNGN